MSIKKYFVFTSCICFFMFFNNVFVYSQNEIDPWESFHIQSFKNIKTSAEMISFISIKFNENIEDLEKELLNDHLIGLYLSIKPEKVKDINDQLLEKTKRNILIINACYALMDHEIEFIERSANKFAYIAPKMKDLLNNTAYSMLKMCMGDTFSANFMNKIKRSKNLELWDILEKSKKSKKSKKSEG